MTGTEPPVDEARARELLRRERDRIERSLGDLERLRESELEEVETAIDPVDDAEVIEETTVDDALTRHLRVELEAVERRKAAGGRHLWILGGERRADPARASRDDPLG
jgi:hypothetical protein